MKVKIEYYASLREQAKKNVEFFETHAKTPMELYRELTAQYEFTLDPSHLKVAINEEYSDFTNAINEGDTIVFIPPVAGG